ncbi:carbohydrate-binding domain-containing protein [Eupransor demetentiae]|uniref:Twin-arginine protein secretion pathway component TatC (TatC) n=1 Tax=Eupransor demetentiae TaxID=3109584 RepID=A0ABP0ENW2_9LACO|nr:Twin-arginine protein secretion pathway component TatC (TatC) [Lactobacillaceae bacterium LMG 33000]
MNNLRLKQNNSRTFKMYKSGKQWVIAAMAVAGLSLYGALAHNSASADSLSDNTVQTLAAYTMGQNTTTTSKQTASDQAGTSINLANSGISSDNSQAATVDGNTVTINQAGTYTVSGTSDDAQILVNAPSDAAVNLILNNANLSTTKGAAIAAQSYGSLTLTANGTNSISATPSIDDPESLDTINPNGAIYANGNLTVNGSGELNINSTMNGISADGSMDVNDLNLNVTKSYEALEAEVVNVNSGNLSLNADDDIINAQLDQSKYDAGSKDTQAININGGNLVMHGAGDGLDSNGDININGGNIVSMIDSTPDNGAIDGDGTITFKGGNVIWGGTGTEGTPDADTSSQSYVKIGATTKGDTVTVSKDGQDLTSFESPQNTDYMNISFPGITAGDTYQVSINGTSSDVVAGQGGGSGMTGEGGPMGGGQGMPPMDQAMKQGQTPAAE